MHRAQLPLSLVEVALGSVLILSVALGFALGTPAPDVQSAQLDAYAEDTATILSTEQPRHGRSTRLHEVAVSEAAFERERTALNRRVGRILPDNVLYRVETPHGAVGTAPPQGVPTGTATVPTGYGSVKIEVWYV